MTAKYYAILTTLGAAKLANAMALGTKLEITTMAVGDGGGVLPTPDASQTAIIGEQRRAPINMLSIDPANPGQIIAEQVIPENEGGFWIRTIGLFDKDGTLIAVANCPETYKPQLQEGSGRTQTIRMILIVSNTDAITLKIDPSVVLATRKYVDDRTIEVKVYADDLMAAHLDAANPHNQYAPKASPALTGTPTAPTPVKTDNTTKLATTAHVKQVVADYAPLANPALTGKPTAPTAAQTSNDTQLATTAFVKAAITALIDSSPAAMDTLNELAAALNDDPNFAATMTAELSKKMDKASNGADIPDIAAFLNNLGLKEARFAVVTTSQSVTVPDWVTEIYLSGCAAGGGGGAGAGAAGNGFVGSGGGGGGAGQSVIRKKFAVTPGMVISVTIGAGGTPGAKSATGQDGGNGGDGGNTVVGNLLTLAGGKGGKGGINRISGNAGGAPGGVGYPDGGYGSDSTAGNASGDGGAGGNSIFGGAGCPGRGGRDGGMDGKSANGYGAGGGAGGGSYTAASGNGGAGGTGAPGLVIIEW